ncbi:MAG: hypothetical protein KF761_11565 [Salinibacterium sp.]|nr:hypothetical protein [Salinibacterium sp.]
MTAKDLFLLADAALREVVDRITFEQLDLPVPAAWSRDHVPTLRGILALHAKDEAWVPDVIAGRTMEEVGDAWAGDILGDDPVASYDSLNDLATAAVQATIDLDAVVHLSYGDYPLTVFFEHTSYYRAFQAVAIAKLIGVDFRMSDALVDALWESAVPQAEQLREWHVFGPEVEVPAGSDKQTRLLGITGFYDPS